MSLVADYPTYSGAREHLKDVLDATAQGRTVIVARGKELSAVMPVQLLREHFSRTVAPRVRVFSEDGRVIALMEDRPFVSEGIDVEEALTDLVLSLREYVEDWEARLSNAPNHADAWDLVQLVKLSTDEDLRKWFEHNGE